MKPELIQRLEEVTQLIKTLKESLPHISTQDLSILNEHLSDLDLSNVSVDEVSQIQENFSRLADEVNSTMRQIDQYCDDLRSKMHNTQTHSAGVKKYAIAQHNS